MTCILKEIDSENEVPTIEIKKFIELYGSLFKEDHLKTIKFHAKHFYNFRLKFCQQETHFDFGRRITAVFEYGSPDALGTLTIIS